ncbi:MAG TPA: RuvA C-terminal domain-containing protein [Candidatus Limnocylindria bacterium]|nr:RuvA C-terminal domain-containing protein [Candidatus Limnocylindria bacterium]
MTPLSPQRFALQLTIGQSTHDKLRYAQALLSHQIPSGDVAEVLDRALDALIDKLEKRKFAATGKPHSRRRRSAGGKRYVPADVKRTVWERDGGRCTFVSETGHRCPARAFLEFDHIDEVARGGQATAERMRLRCRAHNQYGAECTFGSAFMNDKRRAAAEARARAAAAEQDVVPWLRRLGFRPYEARRAAALCETIPDASLEERVRVALSYSHPKLPSQGRAATSPAWSGHTRDGPG